MTLRQFATNDYFLLLRAVQVVGGVACEKSPAAWYPEDIPDSDQRRAVTRLAKAICLQCPIVEQCFEYAINNGERHGIWGGVEAKDF
jgi:WhiB family transcriptional regulator, redox-sensing transcriptional regulator